MQIHEYKQVVLFGGTSEGRILSDRLANSGVRHTVCVATSYGEEMLSDNEARMVHEGRLDKEEMGRFLKDSTRIIVDATHPYATEVTGNISEIAQKLDILYIRVKREAVLNKNNTCNFKNIQDVNTFLQSTKGNILFTTGSKDIKALCNGIAADRIYARVLPTVQGIEACMDAGIRNDHIIAMHGPFSTEMNMEIMKQCNISLMVTKESGAAGGYTEKLEAADRLGITTVIIDRPADFPGVSIDEAYNFIMSDKSIGEPGNTARNQKQSIGALSQEVFSDYDIEVHKPCNEVGNITISLIGYGVGSERLLSREAEDYIEKSQAVFGAARLVNDVRADMTYPYYRFEDIIKVIEERNYTNVCVLFSGDTGFYSGARSFVSQIRDWEAKNGRNSVDLCVIPGISSLAYLSSKLCERYDDAVIMSLHGNNTDEEVLKAVNCICSNRKVFLLLSGGSDIAALARSLEPESIHFVVGSNLSYSDEAIEELTLSEALNFETKGPVCAFVYNDNPRKRAIINGFDDENFIRGKVPMTKSVIRHESVRRLKVLPGDVVYDIGAGTGSVSIEIASLSPDIKVYAFEKNPEAVALIRENALKLGISNITIIEGDVKENIERAEAADCVFIGGAGRNIADLIKNIRFRRDSLRVVANAISIETISALSEYTEGNEAISNLEYTQIQVSQGERHGGFNLMKAQNPVTIVAFNVDGSSKLSGDK